MSLINQSGRIQNSFFKQTITVTKADTQATFSVTAIVIPASRQDLLLLPEGERFLPTFKIYTESPLGFHDIVHFKGFDYRVISATDWGDYGYYHHFATRLSATTKGHSAGFTVT